MKVEGKDSSKLAYYGPLEEGGLVEDCVRLGGIEWKAWKSSFQKKEKA